MTVGFSGQIQIRADMVDGERPTCPQGCRGGVHRHGRYFRYAHPTGTKTFVVPRFYCPQCGLTISVLPSDRVPYRSLDASRLEAFFNAQASVGDGPDPAPTGVEVGCLRRAWRRLQGRASILKGILGSALTNAPDSTAALWAQLRRSQGALSDILCSLGRLHQRSLLGDYLCLRVPT